MYIPITYKYNDDNNNDNNNNDKCRRAIRRVDLWREHPCAGCRGHRA